MRMTTPPTAPPRRDAEGYRVPEFASESHWDPSWAECVRLYNEVAEALSASPPPAVDNQSSDWSRRQFVATLVAAALAIALTRRVARAETAALPRPATTSGSAVAVKLRVNGRELSLDLEPRVTLLDALREYAGITGPKKGTSLCYV